MRQILLGLAATAFTLLALAGPASATTVTTIHFSGPSIFVQWHTSSATSSTFALVEASQANQPFNGGGLLVDIETGNFDATGKFTGATDTHAEVGSGFSFALAQPLAGASVSASGLPATTCTYDSNGNQTGCTPTTVDVSASWTGQGPITRSVTTQVFNSPGFSETYHDNGTGRGATASGTVAGLTFTASDLGSPGSFAVLTTDNVVDVTRCIGSSC